jgi:hypothetical protein
VIRPRRVSVSSPAGRPGQATGSPADRRALLLEDVEAQYQRRWPRSRRRWGPASAMADGAVVGPHDADLVASSFYTISDRSRCRSMATYCRPTGPFFRDRICVATPEFVARTVILGRTHPSPPAHEPLPRSPFGAAAGRYGLARQRQWPIRSVIHHHPVNLKRLKVLRVVEDTIGRRPSSAWLTTVRCRCGHGLQGHETRSYAPSPWVGPTGHMAPGPHFECAGCRERRTENNAIEARLSAAWPASTMINNSKHSPSGVLPHSLSWHFVSERAEAGPSNGHGVGSYPSTSTFAPAPVGGADHSP